MSVTTTRLWWIITIVLRKKNESLKSFSSTCFLITVHVFTFLFFIVYNGAVENTARGSKPAKCVQSGPLVCVCVCDFCVCMSVKEIWAVEEVGVGFVSPSGKQTRTLGFSGMQCQWRGRERFWSIRLVFLPHLNVAFFYLYLKGSDHYNRFMGKLCSKSSVGFPSSTECFFCRWKMKRNGKNKMIVDLFVAALFISVSH